MATIESYVTQSGKRYMVRYRKPDRTTTKKRGFRTKRDAQDFAATVEVSKQRGEFIDPTAARAIVRDLGPDWLERKRQLKASSFRPLEIAWRLYVEPTWGKRPISSILYSEVQAWVTTLTVGDPKAEPPVKPKSATTVIRAYGVLAAILDDAVKDRRLLANPTRGVDLPRKKKKAHVFLSHEQVRDLADASKYPALVRVLAYCGLRWGEATALRVQDVNMIRRRLGIEQNAVDVAGEIIVGTPKNHKKRSVPFPEFLDAALGEACEGKHREDLVFPGPTGTYLRYTDMREDKMSWFASAVKKSGVPRITPHDLRHTAASFAVSANANVKAVQKMLGHSSAAMTLDVYAELFDDDLDGVAIAMNDAVSRLSVPKTCPKTA
ncbi:tyrosine-type recombinase/integrase [Paeniglutamicibacter cryotolerans]|uniref:Integrase n=1 Tax=Paeniglutamicibacter cryotolerans TaxID=670079 RepID=A0A839QJ79_9MICC|nr:site-specific integrase [Paeniglutamicibacter cryotolerans]MBB2995900.1 integrase [Paeniglutamicibacter cryotolerans]